MPRNPLRALARSSCLLLCLLPACAGELPRDPLQQGGSGQPEARQWVRFADYGDGYRMPTGWQIVDPFRSDTSYWSESSLLGIDLGEGESTRRALLRNEAQHSQILLVRGSTFEWLPRMVERITPLDGDPRIRFTQHRLRTSDGVQIDYLRIEREASGDTPAHRYLLGIVDLGYEALLIDAGGPADRFDPTVVEGFLRSLQLGGGSSAPVPAAPGGSR